MAGYMIVGMFDCPWFAKACILVEYLEKQDPTRKFTKIMKDSFEWQEFVDKAQRIRGWEIKRSPAIWEILIDPEGKGNLIGDIDDFCEYINLVFGATIHVSTYEIEQRVCKNKATNQDGHDRYLGNKQKINIAVVQPPIRALELLLTQLLSAFPITNSNIVLNFRIFDTKTPARELQGEKEDYKQWLSRVESKVTIYAESLNAWSASNCKLLIGCNGPQCLIGEIFRKTVTTDKIPHGCIATIGQHVVNRAKGELSLKADIPSGSITRLHAWGWPGMTGAWVEVRDALVKNCGSSIQGPTSVFLPLSELAQQSYYIFTMFMPAFLRKQKDQLSKKMKKIYSDMSLAEAIICTLHVWFESTRILENKHIKCPTNCPEPEETSTEPTVSLPVISVGIPCAKSTGLPAGTFLVQPAMCYLNRWLPTGKISDGTSQGIYNELTKLWILRQAITHWDHHQGEISLFRDEEEEEEGESEDEDEEEEEEEFGTGDEDETTD
ncbi:unnamed protein product [Allacma fusca]|uniref:Uncharacterized protein n=1 Tax=Allacma fusca TaxID=39272 RepID=A0A8J2KI28_9HEXA|nr:unnamed protein product [Allacma fusca]